MIKFTSVDTQCLVMLIFQNVLESVHVYMYIFQLQIRVDNFMWCHTEVEIAAAVETADLLSCLSPSHSILTSDQLVRISIYPTMQGIRC